MGIELEPMTATFRFGEDTALPGGEVVCLLDLSIRDFVAWQRVWMAGLGGDLEQLAEAYAIFGEKVLVGWNLERGGEPIPATGEGLTSLAARRANAILDAWVAELGAKSPNSPAASANGDTSEAEREQTAAS